MMNWILIRAAGIAAYMMLWLAVAWGLAATTSAVSNRVSKQTSTLFHQFAASAGLTLLAAHMGLLIIDKFMPYSVLDTLVPMRSTFRPVAITFGVIAMYGVVIVMVTSWLRKPIGTLWWRKIHLLAVPAFTLAFAHGVFAGSDTNRTWMVVMYAVTGTVVLFLIFVRALTYGYRPVRATPPQRAARPVAAAPQGSEPAVSRAPEPAPPKVPVALASRAAPRAASDDSPGFYDAIKSKPQPRPDAGDGPPDQKPGLEPAPI
jgi:methionine sulfoxide reductase heme-binding subunit